MVQGIGPSGSVGATPNPESSGAKQLLREIKKLLDEIVANMGTPAPYPGAVKDMTKLLKELNALLGQVPAKDQGNVRDMIKDVTNALNDFKGGYPQNAEQWLSDNADKAYHAIKRGL